MGGRGGAPMRAQKNVPAAPAPAPTQAPKPAPPTAPDARVLAAFNAAPAHPVSKSYKFLADVQDASGLDRETFVATLKAMDRAGRIELTPNQGAMTPRERAAGFSFGGQHVGVMRVGR